MLTGLPFHDKSVKITIKNRELFPLLPKNAYLCNVDFTITEVYRRATHNWIVIIVASARPVLRHKNNYKDL